MSQYARTIGPWLLGALLASAGCTPVVQEKVPDACLDPGTGSGALRRLTNREFASAVSRLIGRTWAPPRELPPDLVLDGFDNLSEAQFLSPLLLERYEEAVTDAIATAYLPVPVRTTFTALAKAPEGTPSPDVIQLGEGRFGVRNDAVLRFATPSWLPPAGRARLGYAYDGPSLPGTELVVRLDDAVIGRGPLTPGEHVVELSWAAHPQPFPTGRRLMLNALPRFGTDGTLGPVWMEEAPPDPAQALRRCQAPITDETACARASIEALAVPAWRRPITETERARLLGLVSAARAEGDGFDEALQLALRAILLSPNFLFRVEGGDTGAELTPDALATRLAFLLTGEAPDDTLRAAAAAGTLAGAAGLRAEAERLLASQASITFVHSFFGQWLSYRDLVEEGNVEGSEALGDLSGFRAETDLFVADLLARDAPVRELLASTQTFVDATTARFYGLPVPQGSGFVRASLEGLPRRGVITHPSVLIASAPGSFTQPAKRGRFVLSRFLCREPPAPPADISNLLLDETVGLSPRAQFEAHRARSECISCHTEIDPIGFALESYDVRGAYRTEALGLPIDPSGEWPGYGSFDDAIGMVRLLEGDAQVPGCLARHLLVYALGRRLGLADEASVDAAVAASDGRLRELVLQVVLSPSFRAPAPVAAGGP